MSTKKYLRAQKGKAQGLAWSFPNKQTLKPQLYPYQFAKLESNQVRVKVLYFGVGSRDLQIVKSNKFDVLVPGQEVVGVIQAVGENVGARKTGEFVGVGLFKDNQKKTSNYFNGFGGFNSHIQVPVDNVFPLPNNIPFENAAPLFSAGITAFNIIHSAHEKLQHKFNRKLRVCIVGLGAVGHMAVKFANQYNYEVTVFSHNAEKEDILKKYDLKYDHFVVESQQNFNKNALKFDLVFVSGELPTSFIQGTLNLSRRSGKVVFVNPFTGHINLIGALLVVDQKQITGARIGNKDQFYKMLELVGKVTSNENKSLLPVCEQFSFGQFQIALEKVQSNSVVFKAVVKVEQNVVQKFNNGDY